MRPGSLLPPVVAGWPTVLHAGDAPVSSAQIDAALMRIRTEHLFWPAPRFGADRPKVLAIGPAARAAARAHWADADILYQPTPDAAAVDPERLLAVFADGDVARWATLGGLAAGDAAALLGGAVGQCPWTGGPISLAEAVEGQACLRDAATKARGPARLLGMSRWKRRGLAPFLTGPDGPPRSGGQGPVVVWGTANGPPDAWRAEDGFLRSVGLGLRHVHPLSLIIAPGKPHFDGAGPNSFDACVAENAPDATACRRAAALRQQIIEARLSKYNVGDPEPLPYPHGRESILVPGQVASDASIRLGATSVRDDAALLAATRRRFPAAFLLYKPHPDTVSGLRQGQLSRAEALDHADAVTTRADIATCLDWADRVATITSLSGFEALLRQRRVTVFGRPFYAGWGLTDDVDPPRRARSLSLDELVAVALIHYPRYVDPLSGLPATPEIVVRRLIETRAAAGSLRLRADRAWRHAISWILNRFR